MAPRLLAVPLFATSCFAQQASPLTLAKKAALFEFDIRERFSLDGQILCKLKIPTAARAYIAYNMPDNAYMTGIYLGALAMKYAVTKDGDVRSEALKSLNALHLLANVSGKPGLLARSAWPVNRPYDDDGIWRKSPDGKYWWRGDVSSDQVDGVMYGFAMAYDFVADDGEKARIARDVAAMVDHIVANDLRIVGFDGTPTQWGRYEPEYVARREPMNALLWLQHLKVAHHVTGEERYATLYREFAVEKGYAQTSERARVSRDPMERGRVNHSDDVLLFLAYYPLLKYEEDPALRTVYLNSLHRAWEGDGRWPGVKPEANPYYTFVAALELQDETRLSEGIRTLERFPLAMKWNRATLADYAERFDFTPVLEPVSLLPSPGQAVPIDRRRKSWSAWVMDPYHSAGTRDADSSMEFNGHDYLMAYWLGRHHGYIAPGQ